MIEAVVCDLDGTLLDQAARIRPLGARALKALAAAGFRIVLASGRSWRTVLRIQRQLGLTGPFIAHNGAYGFDSETETEWHRRTVPRTRAQEFVAWADAAQVMVRCYLGVGQPVLYNRFDLAHQLCWLKPEDRLVSNLAATLPSDPVEIFLSGQDAVDDLIRRFGLLGPDYELTIFKRVGYREVNICAPGVDKVEALEALSRQAGLKPDQILAIGDGLNDVRMLKWAGLSVAVGDGHPAAREAAQYITPPNVDPVLDGLRWALPDYLGLLSNTA
ncbi:MAG: HAD family hydrolase [Firmicutes bacterium]|nr:HAD family hydrolase [Bacillota bacterium]